jgi:hypothetical protein
MHYEDIVLSPLSWQRTQPGKPILAKPVLCPGRENLKEDSDPVVELGRTTLLFSTHGVVPEHLVCVSDDTRPLELPESVDHLCWAWPDGRHVSRLNHLVGGDNFKIGDDRLKCRKVAVDV